MLHDSTINKLSCPYCKSTLKLVYSHGENGYAIVRCPCDEYPIIEDILYLRKPINIPLVSRIRARKIDGIFDYLFDQRKIYNAFCRFTNPQSLFSGIYKKISGKSIFEYFGYDGIITTLGLFPDTRDWCRYLKRLPYSPESDVLPTVFSTLKILPKTVVDIGCGITVYANKPFIKNCQLICLDKSFTLVYFSKYFFPHPDTLYVCSDLTEGFPIKENAADFVYSSNCLTLLYNQQETLKSMVKSCTTAGIVFVGDLHAPESQKHPVCYLRPPDFYSQVIKRPFIVFDYDDFLDKIKNSTRIHVRQFSNKEKLIHRFAIAINWKNAPQ